MKKLATTALLLAFAVPSWPGEAAGQGPQPIPLPPPIAAPRDLPFPGTLRLAVDASDTRHKVFAVREVIPVERAGPMVLLYPEWETASHAPTVSVARLAGLMIRGNGRRLEWRRDPVDVHAFHLEVPPGVEALDLEFQYLSPPIPRAGALEMSRNIVKVAWQSLLLYPAGWFVRDIPVAASLRLPPGFQAGTSLLIAEGTAEGAGGASEQVSFAPVSLETLVDSPVYAGQYFRRIDLRRIDLGVDPIRGAAAPVRLDLVADDPAGLAVTPAQLDRLRALIREAEQAFGPPHYRHYDFLVSLSDLLPSSGGVEHLESSEINLAADFFQAEGKHLLDLDLMAHELAHSWNGRFRQPADLWTPNFNLPMRDSLLWVYEGLTELWGRVLAARAGLRTREQTLDALALDAATAAAHTGRAWKSLADSSSDPLSVIGHVVAWPDWQRREDYYREGVLLWLDVEGILRERTQGRKGLDDVSRAFFGGRDGDPATVTYTFEDVCAALDRVAPYDWAGYLHARLETHDDAHLLDGLTRAGYRLVYTGTPTDAFLQSETDGGATDLQASLGLAVTDDGTVKAMTWNGPAFRAGLSLGARIETVDGERYTPAALKAAVREAATKPLRLTARLDGETSEMAIDYHGTLRYPRLERIPGAPDRLEALLRGRG
jgi:predicted metalloprotease with PDZ domain